MLGANLRIGAAAGGKAQCQVTQLDKMAVPEAK